jgi:hypothetical protein
MSRRAMAGGETKMGVPVPVLVVAAVVMLVLGGYLAVRLPMSIHEAGGSVLVKILGGMLLGGGASALLGLGGAILAALVGAASVAVWLGMAGFVGTGVATVSVLGFLAYAVWRMLADRRRTAGR